MRNQRNSNFELLRIVAILMVIILHYFLAGGAINTLTNNNINYYMVYFLESICIIGVNLFVIISAYFLVDKDKIYFNKIVRLILLTYFYGSTIYILSTFVGINKFNLIDLLKSTDIFIQNWYLKTYLVLYLLAPYINIFINNISKNVYQKLLISISLLFSIWPSFLPSAPNKDDGYGIISFILLYFIGGYLKKYSINSKFYKNSIYIWIVSFFITFLFKIIGWKTAWNYNFIFNIIGSVFLFITFSKLEFQSKIINYIATFVFPIYIIHVNPFIKEFLYYTVLKCNEYYYEIYLFVHMIISVFFVFTICILIEIIRKIFLLFLKRYILGGIDNENRFNNFNRIL